MFLRTPIYLSEDTISGKTNMAIVDEALQNHCFDLAEQYIIQINIWGKKFGFFEYACRVCKPLALVLRMCEQHEKLFSAEN